MNAVVFLAVFGFGLTAWGEAGAQLATPPTLDQALQSATVGGSLTLPFSSAGSARTLNISPNRLASGGGWLLYSDDPETALAPGILYRDELPAGQQRVYLYHVNGLGAPHRFSIVLENTGPGAVVVTPNRKAFPSPTGNYLAAGREGGRLYYENTNLPPGFTIPAEGRALLDASLDSRNVSTNQLVGALYQYHATAPLTVSTVMVAEGVDTLNAYPSLILSPNDGSERQGTFRFFDRTAPAAGYTWRASEGIVRLRIGDSAAGQTDPPASGVDAERSDFPTTLRGNYGVTYDVQVTFDNDSGQRAALLLNPRGGSYGGYFRTSLNGSLTAATMVPTSGLTIPTTTGAGVMALLDTAPGIHTIRLEFIPAGATSLPIEILFVPYGSSPTSDPAAWMLH